MSNSPQHRESSDNVVARLQQRLIDARQAGLEVRLELLDGQQATWCEIAGSPTLFVDLSQTAAEQLQQVDEAVRAYHSDTAGRTGVSACDRTASDLAPANQPASHQPAHQPASHQAA